ncbi:MAG TPA: hypothetical protein VMT63_11615 [Bacteroidales bacterium]|nr:hypothetical protein [Bacteroidales bacterium]
MKNKKIRISKYLHELHGEYSDIFTLAGTYFAGITGGIIAVFFTSRLYLPFWKTILLSVLFADIAGGVVANFSSSTREYYQANSKLRLPFILIHIIHPVLLIMLFPGFAEYFIYAGLFTIVGCLIVIRISIHEIQQTTALLMFLIGTLLSFCFKTPAIFIYSIAPLFMAKLILGFSVCVPTNEK